MPYNQENQMTPESLLPEEVQAQLDDIGRVNIVIGIPSYNNARTIGHVVRAVQTGLAKFFPKDRAILVNSDGGSADGTPDIVRQVAIEDYRTLLASHPIFPIHKITSPYHGIRGKGSAIRLVLNLAATLKAKAVAVVDADLRSITPDWVELLVSPVLKEGFDFVSPLYQRHKYDGTITNSIVYPITRALYGRQVRQPIGGDFGFSGRLVQHYLAQDVWHTDVARFGIDIWLTTSAITGGFQICQSFLGAKIHDTKDPGTDLSAMLTQVVGSVFNLMETHHKHWAGAREVRPVPLFGFGYTVGLEPVHVDVERMLRTFRTGVRELAPIWELILSRQTWSEIRSLDGQDRPQFLYPPDLWVKTVYDFALAWHRNRINREHILQALTPLYLARTASFVLETSTAHSDEVENNLETLCLKYESAKPYLLEHWNP
jgi:glycosyltransferase involved in cell wall biosynthesis